MRARSKVIGILSLFVLLGHAVSVQADDLLHFIEAKDHAHIMSNASGIEITDKGVVFVTSQSKGTLLKIIDGEIEAISLVPDVFKDSDLGGVAATADGNLVITNVGSGRVGILDPDLALITRFSQDGDDPGELDKPKDVAVSINNNL